MRINNFDELRKNLVEMRSHYLRTADNLYAKQEKKKRLSSNETWELGKATGGVEACEALILACFGGQELSALMEMRMEAQTIAQELSKGEADE